MSNVIKIGQTGLFWINEEVVKAAKTVKELKDLYTDLPESEHEALEKIHALFHQEDKPSTKNKGGE